MGKLGTFFCWGPSTRTFLPIFPNFFAPLDLKRVTFGPRAIGWRPLLYTIHYMVYTIQYIGVTALGDKFNLIEYFTLHDRGLFHLALISVIVSFYIGRNQRFRETPIRSSIWSNKYSWQIIRYTYYTLYVRVYQNLAISSENYRAFPKVGPHYKEKVCKVYLHSNRSIIRYGRKNIKYVPRTNTD